MVLRKKGIGGRGKTACVSTLEGWCKKKGYKEKLKERNGCRGKRMGL